jgi:hypothetical protein
VIKKDRFPFNVPSATDTSSQNKTLNRNQTTAFTAKMARRNQILPFLGFSILLYIVILYRLRSIGTLQTDLDGDESLFSDYGEEFSKPVI